MKRTRAYYRRQRNRAIERKLGILRRLGGEEYVYAWTRVHTAVSPKEKSTVPAPCAGQNPVMSTAIGTKRLFYPPSSKWMRDTHAERRSTL